MQKGPRELSDSFFVEPSTGRRYNVEDSPYFTVEAVFNNKNYYINMDASRPIEEINFEFENDTAGEWEFVMISTDAKKGHDEDENEDDDDDEDGEGGGDGEEVLDMPPPWSPKLFIEREKYYNLCPKGEKTVFFKKCTVEFFSECK